MLLLFFGAFRGLSEAKKAFLYDTSVELGEAEGDTAADAVEVKVPSTLSCTLPTTTRSCSTGCLLCVSCVTCLPVALCERPPFFDRIRLRVKVLSQMKQLELSGTAGKILAAEEAEVLTGL